MTKTVHAGARGVQQKKMWDTLSLRRGRMVHRLSITTVPEFAQQLLAKHQTGARCSLSQRERVRVRGKYAVTDAVCGISQRLLSKT
jgi:hypothetical protein